MPQWYNFLVTENEVRKRIPIEQRITPRILPKSSCSFPASKSFRADVRLNLERSIDMTHDPTKNEIDFIRESLMRFNEERVGKDGHSPLCLVEHDTDGSIIGGLIGGTYWGWMYVDILWIHENHRRKGIGSTLLAEAEKEAVRRGCHHVHLDTMSWQAPDFYKKHGYEVIGILPDIPEGNQKYLLQKTLPPQI